jgi:excisionase family DNA binding protein
MDRLLTAEEVAERLGVRTDWVWAQARAGRIPHVRLGRYRRFRESALEAWVCGLEADSTSPKATTPRRTIRFAVARSQFPDSGLATAARPPRALSGGSRSCNGSGHSARGSDSARSTRAIPTLLGVGSRVPGVRARG